MSFDPFSGGSITDPIISVGKSKFKQSYLKQHILLGEFGKFHKCKKCGMRCEDTKPICDECIGLALSILELEEEGR